MPCEVSFRDVLQPLAVISVAILIIYPLQMNTCVFGSGCGIAWMLVSEGKLEIIEWEAQLFDAC